MRFQPGFTVDGGGGGGSGYKFFFVNIVDIPQGGRFALEFEGGDNGSLNFYAPNDVFQDSHTPTSMSMTDLNDGQWHVYRFHVNAAGGFMQVWIDGVNQGTSSGWDTAGDLLRAVSLARNMNQDGAAESLWWGYWKGNRSRPATVKYHAAGSNEGARRPAIRAARVS